MERQIELISLENGKNMFSRLKNRHFFDEIDPENCYELDVFIDFIIKKNIKEWKVSLAKIELNSQFFFCSFYNEVGEKNSSCGKECKGYFPLNKKSGRCYHSKHTYTKTNQKFLIKIK